MVASLTPLPVIGVPIRTSSLDGVDSLYSIVQVCDVLFLLSKATPSIVPGIWRVYFINFM